MDNSTNQLFLQLAVVLGLSATLGFVIKKLRLPLLVAYLLAGVVLSLMGVFDLHTSEVLTILPEIGIAFVLFFIGMELDMKEIKALGKPILAAGLGQIIISALAGFVIAALLGFKSVEALFLGIGLSVSSTIVVIKLLLEKKDLASLYGKLALGILLLEDLVSVLILMGLTVGSSFLHLGLQNSLPMVALVAKGVLLFGLSLVFSNFVLTRVFRAVSASTELLFLSAIAWCFIFVGLSLLLGFSVVIGAFLAGVALANSPFHFEIQGKVKPLRDFFVTLFFVYLGSQVAFADLAVVLPLIAAFTLFALFAKPVIFLLILGSFGFKKHTIFQAALSLSQVSEFSLIIMVVGLKMGLISQPVLTAMALVGVLSIILSSIMISSSKRIYKSVRIYVALFEHGKFTHTMESHKDGFGVEGHVVLVGAHRTGGAIAEYLQREKIPVLVLDFNPKVVSGLLERGINALYGDIGDPEISDSLNLDKARMVISTAQSEEDNLILLTELKRRNVSPVVIVRASSAQEARAFYKAGADFVILPELLAGDFVLDHLKAYWPNLGYFKNRGEVELKKLTHDHLAFA